MSLRDRRASFFDRATTGCLYALILVLPVSISGIEIMAFLTIACFCLKKAFKPEFYFLKNTAAILLFLFLFFCALSLLNTLNFEKSLHALIFKWFKYGAIFLIAGDTLSTPKRVWTAAVLFLVSSFIIGIDGMSQRFLGIEFFPGRPMVSVEHSFPGAPTHYYRAITASFKHYNDLGAYLVCPLLLSAALFILDRPKKIFLAAALLANIFILSVCLGLTFSRSAWISFVAGIFFMLIVSKKKQVAWMLPAFLLPLAAWPALRERLLFFFISPHGSSERGSVWNIAQRMIFEKPFLGHGLGTFMDTCALYSSGAIVKYAHNCYLQIWAETGFFSLVSFAGLGGWMIFQGVLHYKKTSNPLSLGLTCAVFAFLVNCILDTSLYSIQLSVLFWLFLGLLAASIGRPDLIQLPRGKTAHESS